MKKKLVAASFALLTGFAFGKIEAQNISGMVQDADKKPVQSANVLLLNAADSSLVKGIITDAEGKYSFEKVKEGTYLLAASFTGKKETFTDRFKVSFTKSFTKIINLNNSVVELKAVTVASKKPMFEQHIDRMVINVKNSITNAGGTALEVLEKSPGVTVNKQNSSIAINGKNGLKVMFNGKISYMPMDALVQLLAGISAGNIDRIELITTPPAKYDAEGNAGYINIVLINNPFEGVNGSYFLTAGYGKKPLATAGINFNYRSGRINLFGNYSFDYSDVIQPMTGFMQITKSGNIITNSSFSNREGKRQAHNIRIGLDYQMDSSNIIGALVSGYDNEWTMVADNGATVSKNDLIDTFISARNHEINHWQNLMTNLNFQHDFGHRKVLHLDATYIFFKDNNPNTYANKYYKGSGDFLYDQELKSGKITPIHIQVFSADYSSSMGKFTMEAGAKLSLSRFTNDVSVHELIQGDWIKDPILSAEYRLKENIAAGYTSLAATFNKTSLKAGLRYEYTRSNLGTVKTANIINKKYGELFPTFYISQKLSESNSMNLSYSRRITRPAFNDLAPFTIFFDPKTFYTGNPALQPAIANAVQVSFVHKNLIASLSYTFEDNSIEGFQTERIDTVNNTLYLSAKNFDFEKFCTVSFSLPVQVTSWWSAQNNINGDWREVSTTFDKKPVHLQVFDFNVNSTQQFTLPNDYTIELTGYYYSPTFFGSNKLQPIYQVDVGIQKKFKNKKDLLRLAAADLFNSGGHYRFEDQLGLNGTVLRGNLNFGMVAYKLTYTHNFGNNALKGKRDRSTGAEAELNRVHN